MIQQARRRLRELRGLPTNLADAAFMLLCVLTTIGGVMAFAIGRGWIGAVVR